MNVESSLWKACDLIPAGVELGYDFVGGKYVSQFREIGNGSPLVGLRSYPQGQREASITSWENSLKAAFGEYIDPANIVATFIRLRNRGLIRLLKFVPDQTAWYNYAPDEQVDHAWFFYSATFTVEITDEGRGVWDVPRSAIGFRLPP